MLKVQNATIGYDDQILLYDLSFRVKAGEIVSVIGSNGCGKSTLFKCLQIKKQVHCGKISWQSGTIPRHASVEQNYRETLLPWLTVRENICFPLKIQKLSEKQQAEKLALLVKDLAVELPLAAKVSDISGGQAQLVTLLRALIFQPAILFLDEPFSALDYLTKWQVREFLYKKLTEDKITTLIISHDPEDCVFLSDKVLTLSGLGIKTLQTIPVTLTNPRNFALVTDYQFTELKNLVLESTYNQQPNVDQNQFFFFRKKTSPPVRKSINPQIRK